MRIALLIGAAAALSVVGAAGARAEMVYVQDRGYVETAPAYEYAAPPYAYTAPAPVFPAPFPLPVPGYVVAEPPQGYVVVERMGPDYVRPQPRYLPRPRVVINRPVSEQEIVTTGYSANNCYIDLAGVERCF